MSLLAEKLSDISEIKNTIIRCYNECPRTTELHNDYSGYSPEECAEDILEKISDFEDYEFYRVFRNFVVVGYFGKTYVNEVDCLHTFFVRPKFRNNETLTQFCDLVSDNMNTPFFAGVFSSNEPAKKFLSKWGGEEINEDNVSYFILGE